MSAASVRTSTSPYTYTTTHTATYLTEVILGAIGDLLGHLGIDQRRFQREWAQNEQAIKVWIEEGSLEKVTLECHRPSGVVNPVFEFPVEYAGSDGQFSASRARLDRFRAKLDPVPAGTTYQLFCSFNGPRTPQPGWSPGTLADIGGLRGLDFGTLGVAPHASAGFRYHF